MAIYYLKLQDPNKAMQELRELKRDTASVHHLKACAHRMLGERSDESLELARATACDRAYYSVADALVDEGVVRVLRGMVPSAQELVESCAESTICSDITYVGSVDEALLYGF